MKKLLSVFGLILFLALTSCVPVNNSLYHVVSGTVKTVDGTPIEGALVILNNTTIVTNQNGYYNFSYIATGTYPIKATAQGYKEYNDTVTVKSNVIWPIIMQKSETVSYTLNVIVKDAENNLAVDSAVVTLKGANNFTVEKTGSQLSFSDLSAGNYTLTVSATTYNTFTQSINLSQNQQATILLTKATLPTYQATINIKNASNTPLTNASVTLKNAGNLVINSKIGSTVTFTGLAAGAYSVDVSCNGYQAKTQSFSITSNDVNLNVVLNSLKASVSGKITIATTNYVPPKLKGSIPFQTAKLSKVNSSLYNGILVQFEDNTSAILTQQTLSTVKPFTTKHSGGNIYRLEITGDPEVAMAELRKQPNVKYVQYNYINKVMSIPNDELYSFQWNMDMIDLPTAWEYVKGSHGFAIIAVLDTGILPHLDLDTNIVSGYDVVDNDHDPTDDVTPITDDSHGTHVTSTIAAVTNNSKGLAGAGWNIKVMPIKVFCNEGGFLGAYDQDVAEGIIKAVDMGAKIINLSLGNQNIPSPSDHPIIEAALKYAYQNGVAVFAAAGNDGQNHISYPASSDYTFAVGAVDINGTRTFYSNYGKGLYLTAPGGGRINDYDVIWGYSRNRTVEMIGTSQATAHVSAVAGLLYNLGVTDPDKVYDILINSATNVNNVLEYGAGILNASAAIQMALGYISHPTPADVTVAVYRLGEDIPIASTTPDAQGNYTISNLPVGEPLLITAYFDVNNDHIIYIGDFRAQSSQTFQTGNQYTINLTLTKLRESDFTQGNLLTH